MTKIKMNFKLLTLLAIFFVGNVVFTTNDPLSMTRKSVKKLTPSRSFGLSSQFGLEKASKGTIPTITVEIDIALAKLDEKEKERDDAVINLKKVRDANTQEIDQIRMRIKNRNNQAVKNREDLEEIAERIQQNEEEKKSLNDLLQTTTKARETAAEKARKATDAAKVALADSAIAEKAREEADIEVKKAVDETERAQERAAKAEKAMSAASLDVVAANAAITKAAQTVSDAVKALKEAIDVKNAKETLSREVLEQAKDAHKNATEKKTKEAFSALTPIIAKGRAIDVEIKAANVAVEEAEAKAKKAKEMENETKEKLIKAIKAEDAAKEEVTRSKRNALEAQRARVEAENLAVTTAETAALKTKNAAAKAVEEAVAKAAAKKVATEEVEYVERIAKIESELDKQEENLENKRKQNSSFDLLEEEREKDLQKITDLEDSIESAEVEVRIAEGAVAKAESEKDAVIKAEIEKAAAKKQTEEEKVAKASEKLPSLHLDQEVETLGRTEETVGR